MLKTRTRIRKKSGQELIELAAGLMVLVPIFLVIYDMYVVYMISNLNDAVARDAARAASAVEPNVNAPVNEQVIAAGPNFDRADRVVRLARNRGGGYITNIALDPAQTTLTVTNVPDQFLGGQWVGSLKVRTVTTFNLPVNFAGIIPAQQTLRAEARFPLTSQRIGTARMNVQ